MIHVITRRTLFRATAGAGAVSLIKPASVGAATTTAVLGKAPSSVTLCDPSVSTWIKTRDGDAMRMVHILGTAHISSASAELAGRMVREIKPSVVFVELDAKRVARAIPGGVTANDNKSNSSLTSTPNNPSIISERTNKLEDIGSKYVGNAVKGMYSKLESEGFKAGDEFAMAVKEGLAIGATIVLGDRDVEVTLRRLTKALTKTDIRKLFSSNSEVNSSMESLLPEGMRSQYEETGGTKEMYVEKAEFQAFIETMKAKENVKTIMNGLKQTAPEVYQAMVAERDAYMGQGLDELDITLKDNNVKNTVAVMGMAHVDGVEQYLESKGWSAVRYPCPVVS